MINPLNELSSVYTQNIAEGYAPGDVDQKVGAVTAIPKDEREAAKARLLAKAKAKRAAKLKEGHCDECEDDPCECSPEEKKKDSKKKSMKENFYSNWREDLIEVVDPAESEDVVGSSSKRDGKEIKEKTVKNKIKINPPQGVTEGFQELGGVVLEMYELSEADMTGAPSIKDAKPVKKINVKYDPKMKVMAPTIKNEKLDLKKADMGEVIKDFRKSDAPQFKGKSDKKIQKMAIAAKLEAEDGVNEKFVPPYEPLKTVSDDQRKKREMAQKTKDHDDKMAGKLAEGGMSIEDQMRISREYNRKSPEERKAMVKKALSGIKKGTPKKDTRTDAQKMTDATGPRPGSRYRGD